MTAQTPRPTRRRTRNVALALALAAVGGTVLGLTVQETTTATASTAAPVQETAAASDPHLGWMYAEDVDLGQGVTARPTGWEITVTPAAVDGAAITDLEVALQTPTAGWIAADDAALPAGYRSHTIDWPSHLPPSTVEATATARDEDGTVIETTMVPSGRVMERPVGWRITIPVSPVAGAASYVVAVEGSPDMPGGRWLSAGTVTVTDLDDLVAEVETDVRLGRVRATVIARAEDGAILDRTVIDTSTSTSTAGDA